MGNNGGKGDPNDEASPSGPASVFMPPRAAKRGCHERGPPENVCVESAQLCENGPMNDRQFSLLSGEEIESDGLIDGGSEELFRASTYDLSVGDIILAG